MLRGTEYGKNHHSKRSNGSIKQYSYRLTQFKNGIGNLTWCLLQKWHSSMLSTTL